MSPLVSYARSAEMAARRIAHTIATMPADEAANVANNAGRAALRKCIAVRLVAAESGAEVIDLNDVIDALTVAIEAAEVYALNATIADYRDAARSRAA